MNENDEEDDGSEEFEMDETSRAFIERVQSLGEVWGLRSEDGWAYCESAEFEATDVIVFWSDRAAAARHATGDWADHAPTAIPLREFVENWLPGMDEDGVLIGPDWDQDLTGQEVEPSELAAAFQSDEADAGDEE